MNVCMPDGTDVRASSILGKREHAEEPTFGLYMDAAWQPSWPSEFIPWPDRGLPLDWDRAASQIAAAFLRARSGDLVEIGCLGGLVVQALSSHVWLSSPASRWRRLFRGSGGTTTARRWTHRHRRHGCAGSLVVGASVRPAR